MIDKNGVACEHGWPYPSAVAWIDEPPPYCPYCRIAELEQENELLHKGLKFTAGHKHGMERAAEIVMRYRQEKHNDYGYVLEALEQAIRTDLEDE